MAKTCFITGINAELYKDFKTACAYFDISIKEVLTKHMYSIVKDYQRSRKMFDKPKIYKKVKGEK